MLRLSLKYIRFFKEQSFYVLLGIVVTVAILTSVNSAFETNNKMALERAREISGDYHYWYNQLSKDKVDTAFELKEQCQIEKMGYLYSGKVYSAMENPTPIGLKAADPGYREMFEFELLEGRYPEKEGEIILEEYVLAYFTDEGLGAQIQLTLDGETDTYTVVGILEDMEGENIKGFGQKWIYVSENEIEDGYYQLLVKFDERKDILKLQNDFTQQLGVEKAPSPNRNILLKIDYQTFIGKEYINLSSSADEGGEGYGVYFKEWLAGKGIDKTLGTTFATVFSMIILYSIFQISVQQRIREYGKMQAFGIERKDMMLLLGGELFLMFLVGFPVGTLVGAIVVWGIYRYFTGIGAIAFSVSFSELLSREDILRNIGIFFFVLVFIVCVVMFQLSRMNVLETIRGEKEDRKRRRLFGFRKRKGGRIWSKKTDVMMPVVLFKQFLEKKGRVITMILMLAVGGTVFLVGSYLEEQTVRNNRLTQITDSGTNADIRVSIEHSRLANDITSEQVKQIKELPKVWSVEPVSYYFGAILLERNQIKKEIQDSDFSFWSSQDKRNNLASVGGTLTEEGEDKYNLKSEIYGYDDTMLEELKDFLLDGDIDSVKYEEDVVILQTVMNGIGDWDIIQFQAGDQITIRFPKESIGWVTDENQQILGMVPEGEYKEAYEERTFTIGAVVKGGIADNTQFLVDGYASDAGIILPNDRFHEIFDADGYNMVSVQLKDKKTADEAAREIRSITKGIEGISVIDFTDEIVRNQEYLDQTMILMRIIVLLLLAIGFFNTVSSVNYMLLEKRKEFVVMRAMGITDVQLTRMMIGEGAVYGVIVSVLMIVFSLLIQIPVKYFLDHGFVYLNAQYTFNWLLAFLIAGLNILLSVVAVLLPAKRVLFNEIAKELADL